MKYDNIMKRKYNIKKPFKQGLMDGSTRYEIQIARGKCADMWCMDSSRRTALIGYLGITLYYVRSKDLIVPDTHYENLFSSS